MRNFFCLSVAIRFTVACLTICCYFAPQSACALSTKDLFKQAGSYETQGEQQKAKQAYSLLIDGQSANSHDPYVSRSRVRLGRIYLEQGNLAAADDVYRAVLKLDAEQIKAEPELMIDMDDLAEIYVVQSKKVKDGKQLLLRALEVRKKIDPNHPRVNESYRALATYMIMHSDLAQAKSYITHAINNQKSADTPKKLDRLASDQMLLLCVLVSQKNWQECELTAKKFLSQDTKHPTLHWCWSQIYAILALSYSRQGKYDLSDGEYKNAIEVTKRFAALNPAVAKEFSAKCQKSIEENKVLRQKVSKH